MTLAAWSGPPTRGVGEDVEGFAEDALPDALCAACGCPIDFYFHLELDAVTAWLCRACASHDEPWEKWLPKIEARVRARRRELLAVPFGVCEWLGRWCASDRLGWFYYLVNVAAPAPRELARVKAKRCRELHEVRCARVELRPGDQLLLRCEGL